MRVERHDAQRAKEFRKAQRLLQGSFKKKKTRRSRVRMGVGRRINMAIWLGGRRSRARDLEKDEATVVEATGGGACGISPSKRGPPEAGRLAVSRESRMRSPVCTM
jgi:hypothetical protein